MVSPLFGNLLITSRIISHALREWNWLHAARMESSRLLWWQMPVLPQPNRVSFHWLTNTHWRPTARPRPCLHLHTSITTKRNVTDSHLIWRQAIPRRYCHIYITLIDKKRSNKNIDGYININWTIHISTLIYLGRCCSILFLITLQYTSFLSLVPFSCISLTVFRMRDNIEAILVLNGISEDCQYGHYTSRY